MARVLGPSESTADHNAGRNIGAGLDTLVAEQGDGLFRCLISAVIITPHSKGDILGMIEDP